MNRVVHFEIQADDIDRAKNFYQAVLGWNISKIMNKEEGGMDYWGVETGEGPGINGGMYLRPPEEERKFYLYDCTIQVENIDSKIDLVKENGGEITFEKSMIPGVGWFAGAKDTEGNRFGIMQATEWKPE